MAEWFKRGAWLDQDFVNGHGQGRLARELLFDRLDQVVRHERLAVILADVAVGVKAGLRAQVTRKLAAVIVLDDDARAWTVESMRLISSAWKGTSHLIWSWFATMPSSAASFSTASRITPWVEPQPTSVTAAFSGPNSRGGNELRQGGLHLAPALLDHHPPLVRVGELVADQRAVLIVLVGGRDEHDARARRAPRAGKCRWRCS